MLVTKLVLLFTNNKVEIFFVCGFMSALSSSSKPNFYLYVHLNIEIFLYV
jgi:hypothetical protein